MAIEKFGSDAQQVNTITGGLTSADGAPLLDTNSDGGRSTMFGPAAIREIQNGVANGDFGLPPTDPSEVFDSTSNNLPYWDFTDESGGNITLSLAPDSSTGYTTSSGYALRAIYKNAAATPDYARLERWVPILGGSNRPSAYNPEFTALFATNTNTVEVQIYCQFYKEDKLTAVGTAWSRTVTGAQLYAAGATGTAGSVATVSSLLYVQPDQTSSSSANWLRSVAPANAAYLRILMDFQVPGAGPTADVRVDIAEVRLPLTQTDIILSDKEAPATYGPSHIWQQDGALWVAGAQGFTNGAFPTTLSILPDAGGVGIVGPVVLYSGTGGTGLFNEMAFISIGNEYWLDFDYDILIVGEMYVPYSSIYFMNGEIRVDEGGITNQGPASGWGGYGKYSTTFTVANNVWTTMPLNQDYFLNTPLEGLFVDATDDAIYPVGGSDINGMGWYVVSVSVSFPADADGYRGVRLQQYFLNSGPMFTFAQSTAKPINSSGGSAVEDTINCTGIVYLNAGHDITDEWTGVRVQIYQNSGGTMAFTPALYSDCVVQMTRCGA
jgi:hypothetical protein